MHTHQTKPKRMAQVFGNVSSIYQAAVRGHRQQAAQDAQMALGFD